jgi:hypothetical protein
MWYNIIVYLILWLIRVGVFGGSVAWWWLIDPLYQIPFIASWLIVCVVGGVWCGVGCGVMLVDL